jgi:protease I
MFILQGEPYWRRPACIRIIRRFFEQEKPVAHLCHGAPALASAGLLNGGRTAAYPALEPDVEAAGAYFVDSSAIDDGTMVSAGVWPTIRRGCGNSCGC